MDLESAGTGPILDPKHCEIKTGQGKISDHNAQALAPEPGESAGSHHRFLRESVASSQRLQRWRKLPVDSAPTESWKVMGRTAGTDMQ